MDLITQCDFVWVQFYNNPSCQIGSSGFEARLQQWSKAIAATSANTKMFLGAPAFLAAGPGAYVAIGGPQGMIGVAEQLNSLKLTNSGGIMFWDGAEGLLNIEAGRNIIDVSF
jgi:chitinase